MPVNNVPTQVQTGYGIIYHVQPNYSFAGSSPAPQMNIGSPGQSSVPGQFLIGEASPGSPGLTTLNILAQVQYNIQTNTTATAIIEWNIGLPISSQIRQTSADRTDFAY